MKQFLGKHLVKVLLKWLQQLFREWKKGFEHLNFGQIKDTQ